MLPTRIDTVYFMQGLPAVFADVVFTTDGTPDDYSDRTFTARWRQSAGYAEYIELSVDDSEANVGHIIVTATGAQTLQMTRLGVWEVQSVVGAGEPESILAGNSVMVPDVVQQ